MSSTRPPPNAMRDPEGYLASRRFSLILKCPRTGLPVSYADLGEEDGPPVLWVLPSGCSRWVAAAQDPLARLYGIRLIVIDRPGCGATPPVPLADRIRISGDMAVSVLEHLGVKLDHLIVNSAGIYYALDLLLRHPTIFTSSLNPPPSVYMISPWSPLLPTDHPDYYSSYFTWIPSPIIATQHITLPQLAKFAENSSQIWSSSTKAFWSGLSAARSLVNNTMKDLTAPQPGFHIPSKRQPQSSASSNTSRSDLSLTPSNGDVEKHIKLPLPEVNDLANVPEKAAPMVVQGVPYRSGSPSSTRPLLPTGDGEESKATNGEETREVGVEEAEPEVVFEGDGLWGKLPCCISCTTTEYMQAETFSGIGQEHLVCLNRGPTDTGYLHLERAVDQLAKQLRSRQAVDGTQESPVPLDIRIWWGWQDTMVPRKGQLWFNRNMKRYPDVIQVVERDVLDGDHTDLLSRAEGIYEVYALIRARHRGEPLPEPND